MNSPFITICPNREKSNEISIKIIIVINETKVKKLNNELVGLLFLVFVMSVMVCKF